MPTRKNGRFWMARLLQTIRWEFTMHGEELTKICFRDTRQCRGLTKDFKMVLTARGFGLKWRLRKSWDLKIKRILRFTGLISLWKSAKKGSENIQPYRRSSQFGWANGWIGKILI